MPAIPEPVISADPRASLQNLPDPNLYDVARNPSAVHRRIALQLLVERSSLYAGRDDIADEARALILENPLILKKVDPSAAVQALRLPSLIDVVADQQAKRAALAALESQHNADHIEHIAAVESTVTSNKAANDMAVREAYSALWLDGARKTWQLTEEVNRQKAALEETLDTLRAEHVNDTEAANERLRLLERSPWRKFTDSGKKNVLAVRGWLRKD